MAKKTLGLSVNENTFKNIHNKLKKHNDKLDVANKITMSKFLLELMSLGLSLYVQNNNSIENAKLHIQKIKINCETCEDNDLDQYIEKEPVKKVSVLKSFFS